MNFPLVLRFLGDRLTREGIDFALIGGLGLQASGLIRSTRDIDVLVPGDAVPRIREILLGHGYTLLHESEDVSNYLSDRIELGRIDLLHARRSYSIGMLARAHRVTVLEGSLELKVLQPEDLIGLKVQSSANDPRRRSRDIGDIEALIRLRGGAMDMGRIREYFRLFGLEAELSEILRRCGHAETE